VVLRCVMKNKRLFLGSILGLFFLTNSAEANLCRPDMFVGSANSGNLVFTVKLANERELDAPLFKKSIEVSFNRSSFGSEKPAIEFTDFFASDFTWTRPPLSFKKLGFFLGLLGRHFYESFKTNGNLHPKRQLESTDFYVVLPEFDRRWKTGNPYQTLGFEKVEYGGSSALWKISGAKIITLSNLTPRENLGYLVLEIN
jgi:hypothetical protein